MSLTQDAGAYALRCGVTLGLRVLPEILQFLAGCVILPSVDLEELEDIIAGIIIFLTRNPLI